MAAVIRTRWGRFFPASMKPRRMRSPSLENLRKTPVGTGTPYSSRTTGNNKLPACELARRIGGTDKIHLREIESAMRQPARDAAVQPVMGGLVLEIGRSQLRQ